MLSRSLIIDKNRQHLIPIPTLVLKFLFIVFFCWNPVQGEEQDSLAYIFRQDNLSTNNNLQLKHNFDLSRSTLSLNEGLRYKLFTYENSLTQGKQYSIEHLLKSDWSWGEQRNKSIRLESSYYQDHRTGLASSITNWALLAGVKHKEKLSAFIGGRSVERYGIVDEGWTAELDLHQSWKKDSQRASISISGDRDQLNEHLNHSLKAQANYHIRFSNISTFQTNLNHESIRQSFFTDSLGSSQSRYNENLQWQNRFTYHLSKDLQLFHQLDWGDQLTEINREKVDQYTSEKLFGEERKRFSLVNETGLELKRPNFSSISAFKVNNSQSKYYVDYTQVLYQLREEFIWQIPGLVDSLSWITLLSRLEYDTPDTTNDDDRDEWRLNNELQFTWEPSPFYKLDLGTKLSMFHLIYLFNTRSSENHWNRNLVLWSGLTWHRRSWEGESRARIRSNYFDYDYEDLFIEMDQASRSFVHRSLDLQNNLTYHFNYRWSIVSKLAARWEDDGRLDWAAFVQQVSSEREQLEVIVRLAYNYQGWQAWLGYLAHERRTTYAAENRDAELWQGEGPLLGVRHRLGSRLYVDADARFISVQDRDREYLLPKVHVTLVYR